MIKILIELKIVSGFAFFQNVWIRNTKLGMPMPYRIVNIKICVIMTNDVIQIVKKKFKSNHMKP